MVSHVASATLLGVDALPIEVETELTNGLPYFSIIGLGDAAVKEAKYRIQAALRASELSLPHKRVTINLAPAAVRKDGATLDLPMALCLLVASGFIQPEALSETTCAGELALSGDLRGIRGVLAIASTAKEQGHQTLIVPYPNGPEAAAIEGLRVVAPKSLLETVEHLNGQRSIEAARPGQRRRSHCSVDLKEVRGQPIARRALEVAAAGEHNVLFVGNPGSGKTMLARRLPSILPPLDASEQLEVTKIWSAGGLTIGGSGLMVDRPFRAPHHTVTEVGLVGGSTPIRPGEVSLAHRGVLFLDEMPELPRRVLEVLRQPLEDREVVISRARHSARLPAAFMLVGAANPCPCGWLGHASGRCWCRTEDIHRYVSRISGALLDRIDMVIDAPSPTPEELLSEEEGESSKTVRDRVIAGREMALHRAGCSNGQLTGRRLRRHARPDKNAKNLLKEAIHQLDLSARSMERTLRVAQTIADLEREEQIKEPHLAEALQYRQPSIWGSPLAKAS